MNTVNIITGWHGSGTSQDPYRPALADDHPVTAWVDITNANPLLGGTYTIQVQCNDATLAAINADPTYAGKVSQPLQPH